MTETKKNCAEEMFPLVETYHSSPAIQEEFSTEHGISLCVLNCWIAKYRRERAESGAFLETGVYFYRMLISTDVQTRKMTVLK